MKEDSMLGIVVIEHEEYLYIITGILHGALIVAESEDDARQTFLEYYGGEPIVSMKELGGLLLDKYCRKGGL